MISFQPKFTSQSFYKIISALMFVVDSRNRVLVVESKAELWRMLQDEELKDISVLGMANKQDFPKYNVSS